MPQDVAKQEFFEVGNIVRFKRRILHAMEIVIILNLLEDGLLGTGKYRVIEIERGEDTSQILKLVIVETGLTLGENDNDKWNSRWFEKI